MSELATAPQEDVHTRLTTLKNRYRFLEQVYKYHSSVEDEVRLLWRWYAYVSACCQDQQRKQAERPPALFCFRRPCPPCQRMCR